MIDKKPNILAFSGKAQHGKDTAVSLLLNKLGKKGIRISYGDYLKYVSEKIFDWDGTKGVVGRTLLQDVGVIMRNKNQNFWVDNAINLVDAIGYEYDYVLITDCRFENDITRWKEEGYPVTSIRIDRPNFDNGLSEEQKNHISEISLDDFDFDVVILNTDIISLENRLMDLIIK